jgi:hypothetical protein
MLQILKKLLLLILILPGVSFAAGEGSLGAKADALQYRCEIVSIYAQLHKISFEYGEILINEDETIIYHASNEAAEAFDEVRSELESMYVPGPMDEPHEILIKSVNTYTESTRNIEKALGIFLGEYAGEAQESLELIDKSEKQVVQANKYLSQSLDMHEKLLALDGEVSKSCKKYVAGI